MTFDIGLHEVCVRVGGRAYVTSQPNFLGWIVYQILLPMVLLARESSAITLVIGDLNARLGQGNHLKAPRVVGSHNNH